MPVPPPSRFRSSRGERRQKRAPPSCPAAAVLGFRVFPQCGAANEGSLKDALLLPQPAGLLSLQLGGRVPIGRLRVVRGGGSDTESDEDDASDFGDELPAEDAGAQSPGGGPCWPAGGALSPASPPICIPPPGAVSRRFVRAAMQARALLNSRLSQGA